MALIVCPRQVEDAEDENGKINVSKTYNYAVFGVRGISIAHVFIVQNQGHQIKSLPLWITPKS